MAAPRPPSSRRFPALVALLGAYLGTAEAFVASSSSRVRGIEAHRSAGLQSARTAGRAGRVAMMSERRGLWPGRPTIDLRSDTVTQPTGGMRKAMQKVSSSTDLLSCTTYFLLWLMTSGVGARSLTLLGTSKCVGTSFPCPGSTCVYPDGIGI